MNGEEDKSLTNGSGVAGASVDGPRSLQPPENPIQHQSSSFSSDDEALATPKETDGSDDTIKDLHHEIHTLRLERSDLLRRVEDMKVQMERSDAGARSIAARAAALEGEIDRTREDLFLTKSEADEARAVAESLRCATMDLEERMADLVMEKEKAAANALKKEGEVWSLEEDLESEKGKARDAASEKDEELRVAREKARLEVEEKEGVIVLLKEELRVAREKARLEVVEKEGVIVSLKEELRLSREKGREELEIEMKKLATDVKDKEAVIHFQEERLVFLKEMLELAGIKIVEDRGQQDTEREVKQLKDQNSAEDEDNAMFQNSSGMELTKGDGMKVSWVTAAAVAASTGAVAAAITAFCLSHSRER